MTLNQLFLYAPPKETIISLINIIGITTMDDNRYFDDRIITYNLEKIKHELETKLIKFYLPCKSRIYFRDINSKKVITILRQCLKLYNYYISYKEKYICEEKKKILVYRIECTNNVYKKLNFD